MALPGGANRIEDGSMGTLRLCLPTQHWDAETRAE